MDSLADARYLVTKHGLSSDEYESIIKELVKKKPKSLTNLPMFVYLDGGIRVTLREPFRLINRT